jgi:hypothetical protein
METNETQGMDGVLDQLQELLGQETEALRKLDHRALDALTSRKVELLGVVGNLARNGATSGTLSRLAKIRGVALDNQLLMIHARELVRGALETWAPGRVGAAGSLLETRG